MAKFAADRVKTAAWIFVAAALLLGANHRLLLERFAGWLPLSLNVGTAALTAALCWAAGAHTWRRGGWFALAMLAPLGLIHAARTPSPALWIAAAGLTAALFLRPRGPVWLTAATIAGAAGYLGYGSIFPAAPFVALWGAELFQPGHWLKRKFRRIAVDALKVATLLMLAGFGVLLWQYCQRVPHTRPILPIVMIACMGLLTVGKFKLRPLDRQLLAFAALDGTLLIGEVMILEPWLAVVK